MIKIRRKSKPADFLFVTKVTEYKNSTVQFCASRKCI